MAKEKVFLKYLESGQISLDKNGRFWRHYDWRGKKVINPPRPLGVENHGHVILRVSSAKKRISCPASRVVYAHVTGKILSSKHTIVHKNGNRRDNRFENLAVVTPVPKSESRAKAKATTIPNKLSPYQVIEIRGKLEDSCGTGIVVLADKYGVSPTTISLIKHAHYPYNKYGSAII